MVESVQFSEGGLWYYPVDGVAIVKYGQDGHFDEYVFGSTGERSLVLL